MATTANVHSSVSAAVLPLVLLLALIAATVAFAIWQMARPMEPK
jgi:cytochrome oxidase assembly protein ShyY1